MAVENGKGLSGSTCTVHVLSNRRCEPCANLTDEWGRWHNENHARTLFYIILNLFYSSIPSMEFPKQGLQLEIERPSSGLHKGFFAPTKSRERHVRNPLGYMQNNRNV